MAWEQSHSQQQRLARPPAGTAFSGKRCGPGCTASVCAWGCRGVGSGTAVQVNAAGLDWQLVELRGTLHIDTPTLQWASAALLSWPCKAEAGRGALAMCCTVASCRGRWHLPHSLLVLFWFTSTKREHAMPQHILQLLQRAHGSHADTGAVPSAGAANANDHPVGQPALAHSSTQPHSRFGHPDPHSCPPRPSPELTAQTCSTRTLFPILAPQICRRKRAGRSPQSAA